MTFTGWETLAGRRKALPLGHVTLGSGACSVQDPCAHGLFDLIQLTDSLLSVRNLLSDAPIDRLGHQNLSRTGSILETEARLTTGPTAVKSRHACPTSPIAAVPVWMPTPTLMDSWLSPWLSARFFCLPLHHAQKGKRGVARFAVPKAWNVVIARVAVSLEKRRAFLDMVVVQ